MRGKLCDKNTAGFSTSRILLLQPFEPSKKKKILDVKLKNITRLRNYCILKSLKQDRLKREQSRNSDTEISAVWVDRRWMLWIYFKVYRSSFASDGFGSASLWILLTCYTCEMILGGPRRSLVRMLGGTYSYSCPLFSSLHGCRCTRHMTCDVSMELDLIHRWIQIYKHFLVVGNQGKLF